MRPGYIFLRGLAYVIVHTVHRPKLYGRKPVVNEPVVFACRHVGLMDPVDPSSLPSCDR